MRLFVTLCTISLLFTCTEGVPIDQTAFTLEEHWTGLEGIVSLRQAPNSKHVLAVQRGGIVRVYDSIEAKTGRVLFDIQTQVLNWWDHGMLAFELHPDFPAQPYAYTVFKREAPPFFDNCLRQDADQRFFCQSNTNLVRVRVDPNFGSAQVDQVLLDGICSSSPTHDGGELRFLTDGSLLWSTGDGAQFEGLDAGPYFDECRRNDLPADVLQGAYRSQGDIFLHGKILRINPDALLINRELKTDTDLTVVAKGLRNPFRMTVDPLTGSVYVGDVGSGGFDEINMIPNPLSVGGALNFGWPCMEGREAMPLYSNFANQIGNTVCSSLGSTNLPVFAYREAPVDPANADKCVSGQASITGLKVYTGDVYPSTYKDALFFVDGSKGCAWYFAREGGKINWQNARTFLHNEGFFTDIFEGTDGLLYFVEISENRVMRLESNIPSANQAPRAVLSASVSSGNSPLSVEFSAAESFDDFGNIVEYKWDFDGDGNVDAVSQNAVMSHVFVARGVFRATVTVVDDIGLSSTSKEVDIIVDPWFDVVLAPASGEWCVADLIQYSLSFGSSNTGANGVSWDVETLHCAERRSDSALDCHSHKMSLLDGSGALEGSFLPIPHPLPSSIRLTLTVSDPALEADVVQVFETTAKSYQWNFSTTPNPIGVTIGDKTCVTDQPCSTVPTMCGNFIVAQAPVWTFYGAGDTGFALNFKQWDIQETVNGLKLFETQDTATINRESRGPASAEAQFERVDSLDGKYSLTYVGCYEDDYLGERFFDDSSEEFPATNSPAKCALFCHAMGHPFFGLEFGFECFCGSSLGDKPLVDDSQCELPCPGDGQEYCGNSDRIRVYTISDSPATTMPVAGPPVPSSAVASYIGCFVDSVENRYYPGVFDVFLRDNSVDVCADACLEKGFINFGLEYGVECFCGNGLNPSFALVDDAECNMLCPGSTTDFCGAGDRIQVYELNSSPSSISASPPEPSPAALPPSTSSGTAYIGCFVDSIEQRFYPDVLDVFADDNSVSKCADNCSRRGFTHFGLEYGIECFCGSGLNLVFAKVYDAECNMLCPGSTTDFCGAGDRIQVYVIDQSSTTATASGLSASTEKASSYRGCFVDSVENRFFPDEVVLFRSDNSVERCEDYCSTLGFKMFGLEYSFECFCGNALNPLFGRVQDAECSMLCPNSQSRFCGAGDRIQVYEVI